MFSVVTDMLYKCVLQVDGTPQPVEIMDTSASCDESSDAHLQWAEAFVVVYSVTDKESYRWAASTIEVIIMPSLFLIYLVIISVKLTERLLKSSV